MRAVSWRPWWICFLACELPFKKSQKNKRPPWYLTRAGNSDSTIKYPRWHLERSYCSAEPIILLFHCADYTWKGWNSQSSTAQVVTRLHLNAWPSVYIPAYFFSRRTAHFRANSDPLFLPTSYLLATYILAIPRGNSYDYTQ